MLVTGGSSGIGRETAKAFAREGATVVVSGRNEAELALTVEQIETAGGAASHVVADVTDAADSARLVRTVVERHGGLDSAVDNAGVFAAGPLHEFDENTWQRLFDVNVTGVFLSMKHEIAYLREHGGGAIVNVASNLGAHQSLPNL
ncbi:MAG TPA: SDR family NAD(P)-dependent oxidoreductase, partial [Actinopolymorphaceae bacterium]